MKRTIVLLVLLACAVFAAQAIAAKISLKGAEAITRIHNNNECHIYHSPIDNTPGNWECKDSHTGPGPWCFDTGVDKVGVPAYDCADWFDQIARGKAERRCSAGYGIGPEGGLIWVTVTSCEYFN